MSRYTVEIDVVGNARKALDAISSGFGRAQDAANVFGADAKRGFGSADAAGQLVGQNLTMLAGKADELGGRMLGMAFDTVAAMRNLGTGIVNDAATFQDAQSAMQFSFGDGWKNVYEKVLSESAKLTFTFNETVGLASALGRMKINPFGTTGDNLAIFKSRTGEMVSALQVIQDMSDASGRGTERMMFSIREAVTGDWKSLRDALDLPKTTTAAWKKEMDALPDQQSKYNKLIELSSQIFGGASAMKAQNYTKIMAQLPDILQQIQAGIGLGENGGGLKVITMAFGRLVDKLAELSRNKDFLNSLSTAFQVLASAFAFAIDGFTQVVGLLGKLTALSPLLPVLAAGVGLVMIAVGVLGGAMFAATATALALVAAFAMLNSEIVLTVAAVALMLLPLTLVFGGAMLAAAVGFAGVLAGIAQLAGDKRYASFGSALDKVKIVFIALRELFSSFGETTDEFGNKLASMSTETAVALESTGMYGFVVKVLDVFDKLDKAWTAFGDRLTLIGDALSPTLLPMLTEIKDLFYDLAVTFGFVKMATDGSKASSADWADTGRELADVIISISRWMIYLIRQGVGLVKFANDTGMLTLAWWSMKAIVVLTMIAFGGLAVGAAIAWANILAFISPALLAMFLFVAVIDTAIRGFEKLWQLAKGTSGPTHGLTGEGNNTGDFLKKIGTGASNAWTQGGEALTQLKSVMNAPKPGTPTEGGQAGRAFGRVGYPISPEALTNLLSTDTSGAPGADPLTIGMMRAAPARGVFDGGAPLAGGAVAPAPVPLDEFLGKLGITAGGAYGAGGSSAMPFGIAPAGPQASQQQGQVAVLEELARQTNATTVMSKSIDTLSQAVMTQPTYVTVDGKVMARAQRNQGLAVDGGSR